MKTIREGVVGSRRGCLVMAEIAIPVLPYLAESPIGAVSVMLVSGISVLGEQRGK